MVLYLKSISKVLLAVICAIGNNIGVDRGDIGSGEVSSVSAKKTIGVFVSRVRLGISR